MKTIETNLIFCVLMLYKVQFNNKKMENLNKNQEKTEKQTKNVFDEWAVKIDHNQLEIGGNVKIENITRNVSVLLIVYLTIE